MKKHALHTDVSAPHAVTSFIKLRAGHHSTQIGFTDQRVSPHGGLAPFLAFLRWAGVPGLLEKILPHAPTSNNASRPADTALAFLVGVLMGAKKLAQVGYLRGDHALPALLRVKRLPSQPTLTRFFQVFDGAACNLRALDSIWRWCLERLPGRPGGYTLDLDSTQLLHEDHHHAQGIRTGHTPRGLKRCWNPLLGFLAEAKLVCAFWLRPGNTVTFNNVIAFTLSILERLPRQVRIGLVRADSGFFAEEWLRLLEDKKLAYIVVGKLYRPTRSLITRQQQWQKTEVQGTEVCDLWHQEWSWRQARRVILLRHSVAEKKRPGGKMLLEVPGYVFQMLVTSLPASVPAIEVWRRYNGRAGCEGVIKELDAHFGLPQLCLKNFWSSEAALGLAIFAYNLSALFQRRLGWLEQVSAGTLRFRLFATAAIMSRTGGVNTIRLAVRARHREWWKRLFQRVVEEFSNCNSVEPIVRLMGLSQVPKT